MAQGTNSLKLQLLQLLLLLLLLLLLMHFALSFLVRLSLAWLCNAVGQDPRCTLSGVQL